MTECTGQLALFDLPPRDAYVGPTLELPVIFTETMWRWCELAAYNDPKNMAWWLRGVESGRYILEA